MTDRLVGYDRDVIEPGFKTLLVEKADFNFRGEISKMVLRTKYKAL
jgi:hypothetical protein